MNLRLQKKFNRLEGSRLKLLKNINTDEQLNFKIPEKK